jgi:hexosaminidase
MLVQHCVYLLVTAASASAAVWPAPASTTTTAAPRGGAAILLSPGFRIRTGAAPPPSLARAAERYTALLRFDRGGGGLDHRGGAQYTQYTQHTPSTTSSTPAAAAAAAAVFTALDVALDLPSAAGDFAFGDDESYTLSWDLASSSSITLGASTCVGALRGLETFAQLVESDPVHKLVPLALAHPRGSMSDAPRFPYRGLMMDLSRHFYPIPFVEHTIDAMVAVKLNVLHLHLTDDQSFPVASTSHPELAEQGAFSRPLGLGPDAKRALYTYNASEIAALLQYAVERGVVVVPEFDMPAHSSSWGASHPELMVSGGAGCSPHLFQHGDTLDPTNDATYALVDALLAEMAQTFGASGNRFLHLGGDEVPTACWASDPRITQWMVAHGIGKGDYDALESYFVDRVAKGAGLVAANRTLMYWEEIFNNNVTLPKTAIIQAWKSNAMPGVVQAGHRTTNSFGWYLNHGCNNFGDGNWGKFYENDPYRYVANASAAEKTLVLGGETTMWSECVDAHSFDSIVWPRAAAAAEQLWSPRAMTRKATPETSSRLSELRCRLVGRGVQAAPIDDSVGAMSPRDLNWGGCM